MRWDCRSGRTESLAIRSGPHRCAAGPSAVFLRGPSAGDGHRRSGTVSSPWDATLPAARKPTSRRTPRRPGFRPCSPGRAQALTPGALTHESSGNVYATGSDQLRKEVTCPRCLGLGRSPTRCSWFCSQTRGRCTLRWQRPRHCGAARSRLLPGGPRRPARAGHGGPRDRRRFAKFQPVGLPLAEWRPGRRRLSDCTDRSGRLNGVQTLPCWSGLNIQAAPFSPARRRSPGRRRASPPRSAATS